MLSKRKLVKILLLVGCKNGLRDAVAHNRECGGELLSSEAKLCEFPCFVGSYGCADGSLNHGCLMLKKRAQALEPVDITILLPGQLGDTVRVGRSPWMPRARGFWREGWGLRSHVFPLARKGAWGAIFFSFYVLQAQSHQGITSSTRFLLRQEPLRPTNDEEEDKQHHDRAEDHERPLGRLGSKRRSSTHMLTLPQALCFRRPLQHGLLLKLRPKCSLPSAHSHIEVCW